MTKLQEERDSLFLQYNQLRMRIDAMIETAERQVWIQEGHIETAMKDRDYDSLLYHTQIIEEELKELETLKRIKG